MTHNPEARRHMHRVCLAGPDMFYPDARARGAVMVAICSSPGFLMHPRTNSSDALKIDLVPSTFTNIWSIK